MKPTIVTVEFTIAPTDPLAANPLGLQEELQRVFYDENDDGPDSHFKIIAVDGTSAITEKGGSPRPFAFPEIDVKLDEAQYITAVDLMREAAGLVGDGAGGDLGTNPEYERGMAELIMRRMDWPVETVPQIINTIYNMARENAQTQPEIDVDRKKKSAFNTPLLVDGMRDDGSYAVDGHHPPFRVYDRDEQDWLPGYFSTRSDAQIVADGLIRAAKLGW